MLAVICASQAAPCWTSLSSPKSPFSTIFAELLVAMLSMLCSLVAVFLQSVLAVVRACVAILVVVAWSSQYGQSRIGMSGHPCEWSVKSGEKAVAF